MTSEQQRRCPWCWELIERSAAVCAHCNKEVKPLVDRGPSSGTQPAVSQGTDPGTGQVGDLSAGVAVVSAPDLGTTSGQLIWWASAILIYGILLLATALAYPSPGTAVALVLFVAQLTVAYFINRQLWTHMRRWPGAKVRNTMVIMGVVVVVLFVLGWARRRFLG